MIPTKPLSRMHSLGMVMLSKVLLSVYFHAIRCLESLFSCGLESLSSGRWICTTVKVICHPVTGRSKGYGFVKFLSENEAAAALQKMNDEVRVLHCLRRAQQKPCSFRIIYAFLSAVHFLFLTQLFLMIIISGDWWKEHTGALCKQLMIRFCCCD